jgi:hypothetical protein
MITAELFCVRAPIVVCIPQKIAVKIILTFALCTVVINTWAALNTLFKKEKVLIKLSSLKRGLFSPLLSYPNLS